MSDKQVKVLRILNPFDVSERIEETLAWETKKTLADYFPINVMTTEVVISINGRIVMPEDFAKNYLAPDDCLVVCPVPQGGGGGGSGNGGKMMLRIVAMIVIAVFAQWAAPIMAGGAGLGASMLTAGIMIAGSLLVNALLPLKGIKKEDDLGGSPSYGVDGPKNTSAEGLPVPIPYGTYRMGGNLIASFVRNISNAQYLYMMFNAGEGQIVGISDIELNDQPITNFSDFETEIRLGTADQTPIPWFEDAVEPRNITQELTTEFRDFTTQSNVDKVRLDFTFPQGLFLTDTRTNAAKKWTVRIEAEYRKVGDPSWTTFTSPHALSYLATPVYPAGYVPTGQEFREGEVYYVFSPSGGEFGGNVAVGTVRWVPQFTGFLEVTDNSRSTVRVSMESVQLVQGTYEVRVRRTTVAQPEPHVIDRVFLTDLNEIILDDISYKHTALVGIRIRLSDQLQGLPKVTYLNHGRVVKQWDPVNQAWIFGGSSTPAWILLDMMTNARFGGGIAEGRMDLAKLKTWAEHTNNGGLFFNGIFDTQMNLWDATQHVLRVGHAQLVPTGSRYSVAIEKADVPVMMFSVANMVKDSFKEMWLPTSERANEIEVSYFDKADGFKQRTVRAYDPTALSAGRQARPSAITLFGITDVNQAFAEAVLQLNLNKYILQTCEFQAPIEAIACTVGDLIYVQHDMPQWGYGGRLAAGSTDQVIQLDRDVEMSGGNQYKLLIHYDAIQRASGSVSNIAGTTLTLTGYTGETNVKRIQIAGKDLKVLSVFSSGGQHGVVVESVAGIVVSSTYSLWDTDVLEERDVVNDASTGQVVTLQSALPQAPDQFRHWMFGAVGKVKKPFRVRSIAGSHDYVRTIGALEYNESVYNPNSGVVPTPNYSSIDLSVHHPEIEGVTEELVYIGNTIQVKATVHYLSSHSMYRKARVWVSKNGAEFQEVPADANRGSFTCEEGTELVFKVVGVSVAGVAAPDSSAPTITHVVLGKLTPPAPVTGFTVTKRPTDLLLKWDPLNELDLAGYEVREGTSWEDFTRIIVTNFQGTMHVDDQSEPGIYNYHIRAIDSGGRYSALVTTFTIPLARPVPVEDFVCVQSGGRIEMQWAPNPESDIASYEIREGPSWLGAVKIADIYTNRFTVPAGATTTRTFWTVAIGAPGIYGDQPRFASTEVVSLPDRNMVYEQDEAAVEFPSSRHFLDTLGDDIIMTEGTTRSEYVFEADLGATLRGQNTIFHHLVAVQIEGLTWTEATFDWNSLDAQRPWEFPGDPETVFARFQIARKSGLLSAETDGWRLNGTLQSHLGVNPVSSVGVSYGEGRYGEGVRVNEFTTVDWNIAVPTHFRKVFWLIPDAVDNVVYVTLAGAAGIYLKVGYDLPSLSFYLEDHLARRITIPFALAVDDRILVCIVQGPADRKLMIGKLSGMGSSSGQEATQPWAAAGAYTSVQLY